MFGLPAAAQVRPDFFPEETTPTNSNFEVYSQKNGVNRRASLANLRKRSEEHTSELQSR